MPSQKTNDGISSQGFRYRGRASTSASSRTLQIYESEWSPDEWAALKKHNAEQRRDSKHILLRTAHLERVDFVAARWSPHILANYGWDKKGRDFILKLYQCARKYPRYRDDFVPQANLVLWLRHCAAISAINDSKTKDSSFAGSGDHFKEKDLVYLLGLDEAQSTNVYGVAVTIATASERQEDIRVWTQSRNGRVHLNGIIVDLQALRPDHWNIYLLKFDKTGLLTRRDEIDPLNVTDGCKNLSPLSAAPNSDRGVLDDAGNHRGSTVRACISTEAGVPSTIGARKIDKRVLRPSGSSRDRLLIEGAEAIPSKMLSPAGPTNPPTQGIGDTVLLPVNEYPEKQVAAREIIGGTRIYTGGYHIPHEETTTVERYPYPVVQGGLSREWVPLPANDPAQQLLSAADSHYQEAAERMSGPQSTPMATNGEFSGYPVLAQTQQDTTHKSTATVGTPNHETSSHRMPKGDEVSNNPTDEDSGERLRLGNMVRQLREWKGERERKQLNIESERNALPDVSALKESAARAYDKATELARLADEARQAADSACADFETAQYTAEKIAAAEREVEKLIRDSEEVREELGID